MQKIFTLAESTCPIQSLAHYSASSWTETVNGKQQLEGITSVDGDNEEERPKARLDFGDL